MNTLFEAIKVATTVGSIEWKPTGQVINEETNYDVKRGYIGRYKDFRLTTIVKSEEGKADFGLRIEKDGGVSTRILTLTSNPKVLPGRETNWNDLMLLVMHIYRETENRDLGSLLHRELTRDFL